VRGSDPVALGVEAELPDRRKLVVHHPERHFSTVNYCIAKGSFDHLVDEQLHLIASLENQRRNPAAAARLLRARVS
jgi:hypothetical protein